LFFVGKEGDFLGKKIVGLVFIFLAVFCLEGPIIGGQSDAAFCIIETHKIEAIHDLDIKKDYEPYELAKRKIQISSRSGRSRYFFGKASWYGPGFHGKLTASGEVFDQNGMTAAHRELSLGTRLRVTNLVNGKSTVVTVNDRGPYIEGRHLDLSWAAAKKVEMIEAGVVDVKIEVLNTELYK
jgi:rare lipoprotein A (peptidoglycan hydrolase)